MSTVFARPDGLRKDRKNKVDFEAMWVMAARAGYALAFEELVNRNEDRIYGLALNITQNQEDAEHLLQETFINAHERLHEFRCGSPLVTWLMRICIQKALQNYGERYLCGVGLDEPTESASDFILDEVTEWEDRPEQRYTKTQLNRILSEAIGKLSFVHRIVFLLCDVERFSAVDIADLLGLSVSETRSHLLRARRNVRQYLNRYFSLDVSAEATCAGSKAAKRAVSARVIAKTAVA
jgi:RNA polymerase sigma-70 factor (ECF subfamily)